MIFDLKKNKIELNLAADPDQGWPIRRIELSYPLGNPYQQQRTARSASRHPADPRGLGYPEGVS